MTPLVALVAALAVYRLTLLVVADEITRPVRDRLLDRLDRPRHHIDRTAIDSTTGVWESAQCRCGAEFVQGAPDVDVRPDAYTHIDEFDFDRDRHRFAYLLDCPWCASVWLAGPVAWSAWCFGDRSWWFVPAVALASSAVAGAASQHASP